MLDKEQIETTYIFGITRGSGGRGESMTTTFQVKDVHIWMRSVKVTRIALASLGFQSIR